MLQRIAEKKQIGLKGGIEAGKDMVLLLNQVAAGNQAAFAQLYDKTSGLIFGLLLHILRNSLTAEEVLESVYVEVWQEAAQFDAKNGNSFAWLINFAHQKGIERLRLERKSDAFLLNLRKTNLSPAHNTEINITKQQSFVCTVLESLPATQLEMLEMAYFSGMKESEIAVHLGQPVKIIRENLYSGIKSLRILIDSINV